MLRLRHRFRRPLGPVLLGAGLVILACGGLGDTGFEEPYCEVECPLGSYEVADNDADERCSSTCEPVVECPSWGIPLVTDNCYSCTHITESGKLLPLLPNLGYASFDEACGPSSAASGLTQTLTWIDEYYRVASRELRGDVHIVWTSAEDESILCDVRYTVQESAFDSTCAECDAEVGVVLEYDWYEGPYCDVILMDHRLAFAESANGGSLLFGYAMSWTSWDGTEHDDVILRFDYDLIYPPSTWVPYSQAVDVGALDSDGVPRTVSTHELWFTEWIDLSDDPYIAYRQVPETSPMLLRSPRPGAPVEMLPPWRRARTDASATVRADGPLRN
jgi:hypothetical protein